MSLIKSQKSYIAYRFSQRMSRYQVFEGHAEQAFMIGLFSLLDALLDLSLENLVE